MKLNFREEIKMYCFRGDCDCDNDVDEAYKQGYNETMKS